MYFQDAIILGFRRWIDFSGRSSRSEYWYWRLFILTVDIIAYELDRTFFGSNGSFNIPGLMVTFDKHSIIQLVFIFVLLIPSLALVVRRLHDTNKRWFWLLLILIPLIGWITLLVFYCKKGTNGPNRFGPDPLTEQKI